MVILTVVTKENPHTVYFEPYPIQKPSYIRLLSCSLYNSWFNLKKVGKIFYTGKNKKELHATFFAGNYTIEEMAKKIENAFKPLGVILKTQIYTPVGQMVIEIEDPRNNKIKFDENLSELLGTKQEDLPWINYIQRMNSPTTYFIHCDFVDKEQNLLNGKPSTVLQTFDITGKPFDKVFYQSGPQHVLRDVSADKHISNMTISVRDQNNNLFDFNGFPLQFQIEIN